MKINVKDAFSDSQFLREYTFSFNSASCEPADLFVTAHDIKCRVIIRSLSQGVYMDLTVKLSTELRCDRCLELATTPLSFFVSREIVLKQKAEMGDEIVLSPDYSLDIQNEARELIILEYPAKWLCCEECKGLCPVCGCNLNSSSCSCDIDKKESKFDILKGLFND